MLELDISKDITAYDADPSQYVVEYQLESERGFQVLGYTFFSSAALLPLDPAHFTSIDGEPLGSSLTDLEVPDDTWVWVWSRWYVDMTSDVDDQGWCYAWKFRSKHWSGRHKFFRSFVRQRIWRRPRIKRELLTRKKLTGVVPHMPGDQPLIDKLDKEPSTDELVLTGEPDEANRSGSNENAESQPSREALNQEDSSQTESSEEQEYIKQKEQSAEAKAVLEHLEGFRNDREMINGIVDYISSHPQQLDLLVDIRELLMAQIRFPVSRRSLITKLTESSDRNCQLFILAPTNSWSGQVLRHGEPEQEPVEVAKIRDLEDAALV